MSEKALIPFQEIIEDFNKKSGKNFRWQSKETQKMIRARWEEGFTLEDFLQVHTNQCAAWKGHPRMDQYLRPETLYRPAHFESYLNNKIQIDVRYGSMHPTEMDLKHESFPKDYPLIPERIRKLKERFEN